jgi:hypothetical protein
MRWPRKRSDERRNHRATRRCWARSAARTCHAARGREARLICWATVVFMHNQSRQQVKFQALLAERAHFLRHNLTENERILWRRISGGQLGVAFKRQVPVDRYILDFLAPAAKLLRCWGVVSWWCVGWCLCSGLLCGLLGLW